MKWHLLNSTLTEPSWPAWVHCQLTGMVVVDTLALCDFDMQRLRRTLTCLPSSHTRCPDSQVQPCTSYMYINLATLAYCSTQNRQAWSAVVGTAMSVGVAVRYRGSRCVFIYNNSITAVIMEIELCCLKVHGDNKYLNWFVPCLH